MKELIQVSNLYKMKPIVELGNQIQLIDKDHEELQQYIFKNFPVRNTNVGFSIQEKDAIYLWKLVVFNTPDGVQIKHSPIK